MLYTIVDSLAVVQPLESMETGTGDSMDLLGTKCLVQPSGVIDRVLSSDPAVFLRLHQCCPGGRIMRSGKV